MMKQYDEAKARCGDALLLFRMGDFYELFHRDAEIAARVLGLTLTSRDKGANPIPMAGFPHHQLESYLAKLIAAGFRAAVCEQVEDPRQAKGLVKREITRVVTPGTLTDDALLDPATPNYLASVIVEGDGDEGVAGLAWADLSTGRFFSAVVPAARLDDELARIAPREILIHEEQPWNRLVPCEPSITRRPPWAFGAEAARQRLLAHFGTATLEGFGLDDVADAAAIRAAGAILEYLAETQKSTLGHVDRIVPYRPETTLEIDAATRRSLELTVTLRHGKREGSLLAAIDRTVTAMGARLLADWLSNPLTEVASITERHDAVDELLQHPGARLGLREELRAVYDLPRLLARVSTGRASPRDLHFVGKTLLRIPEVKRHLLPLTSPLLRKLDECLHTFEELRHELLTALADPCPLSAREGGLIRDHYDDELDRLRALATGGKEWIAQYQAEEIEKTGIPTLKIGFNKVFGYYLEVTHAHRDKVPERYHRKQTLKNAERYITDELKQYEEQVLGADERAKELEYTLFCRLRDQVAQVVPPLQCLADALAGLDVLAALAELAGERHYCRPEVVGDPVLEICDGRHPVLDISEPEGTFVPNDTLAGGDQGHVLLITGPNMAGKSTYIRQVALITIMAQMGSFVPARRARIGVADRVFARVGASDELARGQSTFMVEMTETARILNTATGRSLVILDEIGRGTSTYDGISLAWAITEYLHDQIGCRTLFATHYHELTDLEATLVGVRNYNVAVKEWENRVVFLHKIVRGKADKSYGIHVAQLAGVPSAVYERAAEILIRLEAGHVDEKGQPKLASPKRRRRRVAAAAGQKLLFDLGDSPDESSG